MEISQWNSLYNYLTQTKMPFDKIRKQEGKTGPVWRLVPVGKGRIQGKGVGWWIWLKYYVLMYENRKMRSVEAILRIEG
jgi:hypothetical protein